MMRSMKGVKVVVGCKVMIIMMGKKEKGYTDDFGSILEQLPFPGNGARKLVGIC